MIGSVLIPGRAGAEADFPLAGATDEAGAAFVDIAIDQGGCAETSRPTTHREPIYIDEDVVHYCVTNMPAIVPNTSTYALTNSTLSYGLELANRGFPQALVGNKALAKGLNTYDGKITHEGVANAFNLPLDAGRGGDSRMRLVTRADFDGLVCGALVTKFEKIEDYLFVEPKFMQDGLVEIRSGDIITNLPYHPNCTLWFDHHITNTTPNFPQPIVLGQRRFSSRAERGAGGVRILYGNRQ